MGYSKLLKAKQQWSMPDEAKIYLNAALEDLTTALRLLPENLHAIILGNIAYIKFLQEKITQSETYLRKALHYGGRHLYEATLQDIVRFPINPDSEFKELLEIIWKEINE
ncbi:Uncharacterised protein [Streptococcus pneumoniae]|nr:Uncharacterised protein [Streptococcus pneumoniae]